MADTPNPAPAKKAKDAVAFVDGQNLFHAAKEAFGHTYPNYDVMKLSQSLSSKMGWNLKQVRFYTGVPNANDNPTWHTFWQKKLLTMSRQGVALVTRPLRYRTRPIQLDTGAFATTKVGVEKGIDVRIALDMTRIAYLDGIDVILIFSQDQDLAEAADEVKELAKREKRFIEMHCAYPVSATARNTIGLRGTHHMPIDEATYNACLDPRTYLT